MRRRALLATAVASFPTIADESYVVGPDETLPDAVAALADRFRGHEQVRGLDEDGEGDLSGTYLARYQGDVTGRRSSSNATSSDRLQPSD